MTTPITTLDVNFSFNPKHIDEKELREIYAKLDDISKNLPKIIETGKKYLAAIEKIRGGMGGLLGRFATPLKTWYDLSFRLFGIYKKIQLLRGAKSEESAEKKFNQLLERENKVDEKRLRVSKKIEQIKRKLFGVDKDGGFKKYAFAVLGVVGILSLFGTLPAILGVVAAGMLLFGTAMGITKSLLLRASIIGVGLGALAILIISYWDKIVSFFDKSDETSTESGSLISAQWVLQANETAKDTNMMKLASESSLLQMYQNVVGVVSNMRNFAYDFFLNVLPGLTGEGGETGKKYTIEFLIKTETQVRDTLAIATKLFQGASYEAMLLKDELNQLIDVLRGTIGAAQTLVAAFNDLRNFLGQGNPLPNSLYIPNIPPPKQTFMSTTTRSPIGIKPVTTSPSSPSFGRISLDRYDTAKVRQRKLMDEEKGVGVKIEGKLKIKTDAILLSEKELREISRQISIGETNQLYRRQTTLL